MNRLDRCHFCGEAVFKLNLHTGPSGLTDIDWRPWTIEDEAAPTHDENGKALTKPTIRRWVEERPYRLGLVVIDLTSGTYQAATNRPRGALRPGALHKLHFCEEKGRVLYGIRYDKTPTRDPSPDDHSAPK